MSPRLVPIDLGTPWARWASMADLRVVMLEEVLLSLPSNDAADGRRTLLRWSEVRSVLLEPCEEAFQDSFNGTPRADGFDEIEGAFEVHDSKLVAELAARDGARLSAVGLEPPARRHWVVSLREGPLQVVAGSLLVERDPDDEPKAPPSRFDELGWPQPGIDELVLRRSELPRAGGLLRFLVGEDVDRTLASLTERGLVEERDGLWGASDAGCRHLRDRDEWEVVVQEVFPFAGRAPVVVAEVVAGNVRPGDRFRFVVDGAERIGSVLGLEFHGGDPKAVPPTFAFTVDAPPPIGTTLHREP